MTEKQELLRAVLQGVDFTKDQAPIVARQLIKYKIFVYVLIAISTVLFVFSAFVLKDAELLLWTIIIAGIVNPIVLFKLVKLIFFPNLYIYEYLVQQFKEI